MRLRNFESDAKIRTKKFQAWSLKTLGVYFMFVSRKDLFIIIMFLGIFVI